MCLKNAFRCISVSEKYLRGQRVSVLKEKKKKNSMTTFFHETEFSMKNAQICPFFVKKIIRR